MVNPLGFLALGTDETLGGLNLGFEPFQNNTSLYRKPEKIVEEVIDETIKVPTSKTHFDGAKRRLRNYSQEA